MLRLSLGCAAAGAALASSLAGSAPGGGVEGPIAITGRADSVWVSDTAGRVRRLDARTRRTLFVTSVGGYPNTLAVDGDTLWIGNANGGTIVRVSSTTGRRLGAVIQVGIGQPPLQLAAGGRTVWLVNAGDQRVWRIDARTGAVDGATTIAPRAWDSATVTADARSAWVAYYYAHANLSVLVRLDARGRIVAHKRLPRTNVLALAIDHGMLLAAAASRGAGLLLRRNARTGALQAPPVRVGSSPIALALSGSGVWVSSLGEQRALRRIDVATGRVNAGPYRAPGRTGRADDLAIAGGYLWATNAYGIASQLSPSSGAVVGRPIRIP